MYSPEYIKGDLIKLTKQGRFDGIAHGCNCFHVMGAGIAPLINAMSSGIASLVDETSPYGDINKLGTFSHCKFQRYTEDGELLKIPVEVHVYNLYTQHSTGKNGVYVHWDSFSKSLCEAAKHLFIVRGYRPTLGIPLIGCGLAGGNKNDFDYCVRNSGALQYANITVVEF